MPTATASSIAKMASSIVAGNAVRKMSRASHRGAHRSRRRSHPVAHASTKFQYCTKIGWSRPRARDGPRLLGGGSLSEEGRDRATGERPQPDEEQQREDHDHADHLDQPPH